MSLRENVSLRECQNSATKGVSIVYHIKCLTETLLKSFINLKLSHEIFVENGYNTFHVKLAIKMKTFDPKLRCHIKDTQV